MGCPCFKRPPYSIINPRRCNHAARVFHLTVIDWGLKDLNFKMMMICIFYIAACIISIISVVGVAVFHIIETTALGTES